MFPAEIVSALEHEGFSLLIKGDAGTGKTTLALELVSYYSQKGKTLYLATRVSPSKIYQQFPWIEGSIPPENILEAKREIIYPTEIASLKNLRGRRLHNVYSRGQFGRSKK